MTTKSTAAQMIVAEYARESGEVGGESEGESDASEGANAASEAADTDALDRHPDAWYQPDSNKYEFAVRHPDHYGPEGGDHEIKYYKTRDGAATRIRRWYEGEEGADART